MAAKVGGIDTTNLHNSLLSIALGSGLLGFALFGGACIVLCKEATHFVRSRAPGAVAATAALLAGFLNSNTISYIGEDWRSASFVFMSTWALIAFTTYQIRATGPKHQPSHSVLD